jgi:hypothetical protein
MFNALPLPGAPGAGIFVITGVAARELAGPSVIISYLISGIACIICALCYAEFATEVRGWWLVRPPGQGSSPGGPGQLRAVL